MAILFLFQSMWRLLIVIRKMPFMNSYCMTQIMTIRVRHSHITVSIQAIAAKILSMEEKKMWSSDALWNFMNDNPEPGYVW